MTEWKERYDTGLDGAVERLKRELPGWWWRVCECQVSIEASVAPTVESPHIDLIENGGDDFDEGFEACSVQPTTPAEMLHAAIDMALEAVRAKQGRAG